MPIPVSSKASSSAAPSGGVADLFSTSGASNASDSGATFASQFEDAAASDSTSAAIAAQVAASPLLPLHGIRSGAGDTVAGSDSGTASTSDDADSDTTASAALSSDATFAAALQVLAGFTQSQTAAQPLPPLPTGDATSQPSASDEATSATAPADATAAAAPLSPDAALPGAGATTTAAALPGADAGTAATAAPPATIGTIPLTVQPLPAQLSKPLADARARNFAQAATTAPAKDGKDTKGNAAVTPTPTSTAATASTTTAASDGSTSASTAPFPSDPLQALAAAAAPAATAAPATENNAAATVVGGTNAPSLSDLGILSPTSTEAKAAGIGTQEPKKDEKDDSKAVSSASDKDDAGFGTVFSGTTAMGLFSENSARLGTTTDISFGNALKAYRNGGGDIASATTSSSKGGGETRSRATASANNGADALLPGGVPASVHAQAQPHGAQAASSSTTGSDVDEASATRFLDLVKQAVGQPLSSPQRISVELQTPPGETVTVFFSQAGNNGPVRAQLSASDATSLQWLQQQVSSLRDAATGNGATIVWLPPQLDQSQNRQGKDARQDGSRRDSNAKGQSRVRSAEDVALADSLFGANGSLSTLSR